MGERSEGFPYSGLFLVLLGLWIVLRTVRPDSSGKTLVNRILGEETKQAKT